MRECGDCEICCNIVEVRDDDLNFFKPACSTCEFLKKDSQGCSVFGSPKRPKICSSFECGWLRGYGNELDRPNRTGVLTSISKFNGGTWIFIMETIPGAYLTSGKNIIIDIANKIDLPVIISDYNSKPGDDFGDYVLIKDKLDARASQLKGDFICDYTDEMKLYKLNIL